MHRTLFMGAGGAGPGEAPPAPPRPDLVDWLESGRLTLVARGRGPVPSTEWSSLPARAREQALEEFERVVRGNTKAAVIFLGEG